MGTGNIGPSVRSAGTLRADERAARPTAQRRLAGAGHGAQRAAARGVRRAGPRRRSPTGPSTGRPRPRCAGAEHQRRRCCHPWSTPPACCCTPTWAAPRWPSHHPAAGHQRRVRPHHRRARSRQAAVGGLLARLCGAEAAMVVNNNAAAVLLVLAALARDRQVLVSRGESVEIGGGFRVPEVMEQSGARLVDVGTTNRTRLADYSKALARQDRRRGAGAEGAPQQLPRRGLRGGHAGRSSSPRCRVPVVADIGSGLIDANMPVARRTAPAWLADEPAARQTLAAGAALVTFSGDKLLGGPQGGIIAGDADLVAACARHPLARALRPGAHVLLALQEVALAYLDRSAAATDPVLADGGHHRRRAARPRRARSWPRPVSARSSTARPSPAPAARPAPPSRRWRSRLRGDHLAALRDAAARRSSPAPATARTLLDLRTVHPDDDGHLASTRSAHARRSHRRPRRPRQVVAGPGAHRHQPRPVGRGATPRPHHRPRLRAHHAAERRGRELRRRARPRAVPAQHARRRGRRGRLRVRRGRHRGLEAAERGAPAHPRAGRACATAWWRSPRSTRSTTSGASCRRWTCATAWPARSWPTHRSWASAPSPAPGSTTCALALAALVDRHTVVGRPRPAPAVGRPRVRGEGQRHGGHGHAHRRPVRVDDQLHAGRSPSARAWHPVARRAARRASAPATGWR